MRIYLSADNTQIMIDQEAAERILYYVDLAYNELSEDDEITENCELGVVLRRCLRRMVQEVNHGKT